MRGKWELTAIFFNFSISLKLFQNKRLNGEYMGYDNKSKGNKRKTR